MSSRDPSMMQPRRLPPHLSRNSRYIRDPSGQERGAFAIRGIDGDSRSLSNDIRDDITLLQEQDSTAQPRIPPRGGGQATMNTRRQGQQQTPTPRGVVSNGDDEPAVIAQANLVDEEAEADRERLLAEQAAELNQLRKEREEERLKIELQQIELEEQQAELQMARLRERRRVLELEEQLRRIQIQQPAGGLPTAAVEPLQPLPGQVAAPTPPDPSATGFKGSQKQEQHTITPQDVEAEQQQQQQQVRRPLEQVRPISVELMNDGGSEGNLVQEENIPAQDVQAEQVRREPTSVELIDNGARTAPVVTEEGSTDVLDGDGEIKLDHENLHVDALQAASTPSQIVKVLVRLNQQIDKADSQEHAQNRVDIAAAGGIAAILTAMTTHPNHAEVQREASRALANLAHKNNQNKIAIGQAPGGIAAIVTSMKARPDHAELQQAACWALASLAYANDENQVAIGQAVGGIAAILIAMQVHPNHAELQRAACGALRNLALHDKNQVAIGQAARGISAILTAMRAHRNHAELQRDACGALWNLAVNGKNKIAIGQAAGGISSILTAMKVHLNHAELQQAACGALRSLARNNKNKAAIKRAGGIRAIKTAMRSHPNDASVQKAARGALYDQNTGLANFLNT